VAALEAEYIYQEARVAALSAQLELLWEKIDERKRRMEGL
jgi:hypothetical protein